MIAWTVALLVGVAAFGITWFVGRRIGYRRERARIEWMAVHRPCWYCEGPQGARARLHQFKALNAGLPMPYAPAPGDCDYCRWPPSALPKAQVLR